MKALPLALIAVVLICPSANGQSAVTDAFVKAIGDLKQAVVSVACMRTSDREATILSRKGSGFFLTLEGDFRTAEQLADQACGDGQPVVVHAHHVWHYAADAYAVCGQTEKAIAQLRRCGDGGLPNYRLFNSDPHLRMLRDRPAFTAYMSELRRQHDQWRAEMDLATAPLQ
jgi:hypothetical protein